MSQIYWYFASERQLAFERRVAGLPAPWTNDPILQRFKFCNTFRAADRVTQYLIRRVAYEHDSGTDEDLVFQIVAFRTFSNIETWEGIREKLGRAPRIDDLRSEAFQSALEYVKSTRQRLYTGAFILCATAAYGHSLKHENHVALFRHMFVTDRLGRELLRAKSLEAVYTSLHRYPLMGDFMSYQTAIDLNYSDVLTFSENDFTQPGPGALRGIRKVFSSPGEYSPKEIVHWMVDQQHKQFDLHGLKFGGLWGRALHAIDCQGLFCETDKYCREALPQLQSARVRIKSRFAPSASALRLFFPPKWKLNHRLPKRPVLGLVACSKGRTTNQL